MEELTAKGILFDLDGVLVDSGGTVERHWEAFATRNGLAADDILAVAHGRRSIEVVKRFVPPSTVGSELAWFEDLEFRDVSGVVAVPGAPELLAPLPKNRWAVVTSCGRRLALARLEAAGLPSPLRLVTADDVSSGKPDPEGYLMGLSLLGIEATSCVVFEDAPSGIAAARSAGIEVVALATTFPVSELGAV